MKGTPQVREAHSSPPLSILLAGAEHTATQTNVYLRLCVPARKLPRMFPTEVCEFQIPKMRPFLPFPNQLATTVTTLGHPVV